MSILGDYWLATNPPLELKLQVKENELSPKCLNGVIDKVELYSNGNLITDKYEQNLAFNFILFGNWQAKQYIEFNEQTGERVIVTESNPIKGNEEEQSFYMIGTLSSLISNKYKYIVNYYQSSNSNFPGAKKPPWSEEFNFVPSFSDEFETIMFVISFVVSDSYIKLSPKLLISCVVAVGV